MSRRCGSWPGMIRISWPWSIAMARTRRGRPAGGSAITIPIPSGHDPHAGDTFSVYEMNAKSTGPVEADRARMVGAMTLCANKIAVDWQSTACHVAIHGDQAVFFRKFAQLPFVHAQVESPEPARPQ